MIMGFLRDKRGQDMAEYSLLLTLIGAVVLVFVIMMGGGVSNIMSKITNTVQRVDSQQPILKLPERP